MNTATEYLFEILIIDKDGESQITTENALVHALLGSDNLWKKPKEDNTELGCKTIVDTGLDVNVGFLVVDTKSVLTDFVESAFILQVKSKTFESLEAFRKPLLIHLRKRLSFNNIRILKDDISTQIANNIYPLVNNVENTLRRFIALFFTQKIGVDWFGLTVPQQIKTKITNRKGNEVVFSPLIENDVTLIDFDDLGEIIYKQNTGFNTQENIIERIMSVSTPEELSTFKQEVQTNYTKYFKDSFQQFGFDTKWKNMFNIRNKVAHNNLFVNSDLENAKTLETELIKVIKDAESNIDSFKLSVEEQQSILQATITSDKEARQTSEEQDIACVKVIGKMDLSAYEESDSVITEDVLIKLLKTAEKSGQTKGYKFIGLKSFVTKYLPQKGFSTTSISYSMINILKEKGKVEIYDVHDNEYGIVKAIKLTPPTHRS